MKYLLKNTKLLTFILFFLLLLPSCNNEEIFVVEESAIVAEETEPSEEEEEEEEDPNTEDTVPAIDVVDDTVITIENTAVSIKAYLNDVNLPESITLSNTSPSNGVLTIDDNETPDNLTDDIVVYTPNAGFSGIDFFEYTICDAVNLDNCDTATVTITIEPQEDDMAIELKAFPAAYGAAADITGGRGGSVYHVTNLNNSGSGSFRDAISESNRIIVFDVSGTINLTSSLSINADNLTIAGQTAPEGGIAITGQSIYFSSANNVITRYLRFRPAYRPGGSAATVGDAVNVNNCNNSIIDHCSISWGGDEALSVTGNSDTWTLSNNLLAESKTGTLIGNLSGAFTDKVSLLGNLWYNISHRFPNIVVPRVDVINNMVHNWNTRLIVAGHLNDLMQINQINNYYQRGARSTNVLNTPYVNWVDIRSSNPLDDIRIHTSGNVIDGVMSANDDNWASKFWKFRFDITSGTYAGSKQWDTAHVDFKSEEAFPFLGKMSTVMTAEEVRANLPDNVGACRTLDGLGNVLISRDAVDEHYLGYVKTNTYQSYSYASDMEDGEIRNKSHYIAYQNAVSSTPIKIRPAGYDTDNDGMPDVWEIATFGVLTKTSSGDEDNDGYTNIEEFLNQVDK
ncbi:Ig-like domain-containing protein [Algibacter sp. R77976]|uniref:Ig-like domain-containing protein n=1 Tax=Algibacter sp. R77976 TaxID=3093873 RepID=UPI0037C503C2